jgi:hypothetical protein
VAWRGGRTKVSALDQADPSDGWPMRKAPRWLV